MNMDQDMSQSSEEESSGSFEQVEEEDSCEANCLFCDAISKNVKGCIEHCNSSHDFDIFQLRNKFRLDYYGYIKLINYIRTEKPDVQDLIKTEAALWEDEKYLKPVDINDAWLWYDMGGLCEKSEEEKLPKYVNSENGNVTMSAGHFSELQDTILKLSEQLKEKTDQLERLKELESALETQPSIFSVSDLKSDEDIHYFKGYSLPSIHWEMLKDEVRTISYQNAIMKNKSTFSGKTILDLGSGTGILSLMAASSGAKKVIGVEESDIMYNALDIIRENDLDGVIDLVKGRVEDVESPVSTRVDIIISEWMGYFLLFEGMLDSVIFARKKFLKDDGILLPSRCQLFLVGASNEELHNSYVSFWDNVYGFKMTVLRSLFLKEAIVDVVREEDVVTEPVLILDLDTKTCEVEDTIFESPFVLKALSNCDITHLVGYFDVQFQLPNPCVFTTGPKGNPTHWKQTSFFLDEVIHLKKGEELEGTIACRRSLQNIRSLMVEIKIKGKERKRYYLS